MTADDRRRRLTRLLGGAGVLWGLTLLSAPRRVVDALCPELPASRRWAVPLLGARLVVQHAAVLAVPTPSVVRVGSAVDLLHAASMAPLVRSPRYRRAAVISGAVAAGYAVLAPAVAPRQEPGQGDAADPA
ncbi:hypothetical protein [Geodermatophilus sp. DSM 45219]|uniref:hypothetical protein n=1 Tax=Geodermatophilus sp. DSM 45219 TaxID=1881103 RepID=UPI0008837D67|nr:hypothetical protein [Geodermatophilus sp. DSM 45219]SDO48995.1 hypothetical protein SAMN05428965_4178 [Geodermatophilus sp. DSM 45219]